MSSTPQATTSGTKRQLEQRRYLAADFPRLTLRRPNSSPHTGILSPDPLVAHEPRPAPDRANQPDKRTIDSRSSSALRGANAVSRQSCSSSSSSSSNVGSSGLKHCVAEDDHGVCHKILGRPLQRRVFLHKFYLKPSTNVYTMRAGIAQSFLETVNASIIPPTEPSKNGASPPSPISSSTFLPEVCECCCRCGRSPKWQPLGRGKKRSKSYTALRTGISELSGWDSDPPKTHQPQSIVVKKEFGPGEAPLERLPVEVLGE